MQTITEPQLHATQAGAARRCAAALPAVPRPAADVRPCKGAGCACPCARANLAHGEQALMLQSGARASP